MSTPSTRDSAVTANGAGDKRTTTSLSSWWHRTIAPYVAWKKRFDEEREEWGSRAWRLEMVWYFVWLCTLMGAGFCWLTSPHQGWLAWHAPIWLRFLSGVLASASALIALFASVVAVVWMVYLAKALVRLPFALYSWTRWWDATDVRRDHPAARRLRESRERELGLTLLKTLTEAQELITRGRLTTKPVLDKVQEQKTTFDLTQTLKAIDQEFPDHEPLWDEDKRFQRIQIWRLKRLRKWIQGAAANGPVNPRSMDYIAEVIASEFQRWSKPLPGFKPIFGRIFAAHQQSFIDQVGPLKQAATDAISQMKALDHLTEQISKDHPEDFVRGISGGSYSLIDQTELMALREVERLLRIEGRLAKELLKLAKESGDFVLAERRSRKRWREDMDLMWENREWKETDPFMRRWKRERERVLNGKLLDDWSEEPYWD